MDKFQDFTGQQRVAKLLEMLLKRDDAMLPAFCQALIDTGQAHIAQRLGYQGESDSH